MLAGKRLFSLSLLKKRPEQRASKRDYMLHDGASSYYVGFMSLWAYGDTTTLTFHISQTYIFPINIKTRTICQLPVGLCRSYAQYNNDRYSLLKFS
jgi:hypothetical protein